MTATLTHTVAQRWGTALMRTYPPPQRTLVRGEGALVWDDEGRRYVDMFGGLAVNVLGHAHPAVVAAVSRQVATLGHVSNLYAHPLAVELAERLLGLLGRDGRVFFCNSGAEANEAAFKLSRLTGRTRVVAADGGFHGRTMGALALTGQRAKQAPFLPLPGEVTFVPYGAAAALEGAVDETTAAVFLEPIQGENGVVPPPAGYLAAARRATTTAGALLVLDEVQTGVGRTGAWFAHQADGIEPDVVTMAKGLGGGLPMGACVAMGRAADLLQPGQHGTTFGGNPIVCAAALAVLDVIAADGLLGRADRLGRRISAAIEALGHPAITGVRGRGLLLAVGLRDDLAATATEALARLGFLVNAVTPSTLRLAPPLVLTDEQADAFVAALPGVLDSAAVQGQGG